MLSTQGGPQASTDLLMRRFRYARVLWYTYGGILSPRYPSELHFYHQLCSIRELANFTFDVQNENESAEAGKDPLTTNDGYSMSGTLTFKGDDVMTLAAMVGRHNHNTKGVSAGVEFNAGLEFGKDYGICGAMILLSSTSDRRATVSQYIPNVRVRVLDAPGTQDAEATFEVELTSQDSIYTAPKGMVFSPFIFYDNGSTIVNANAPDGVLDTFLVKNANLAFPAGVPAYNLLSQIIDPEAAAPEKYIHGLKLGGSAVEPSAYSYDPATSEITLNSPPADGTKLEGVVLVPSGFEDIVIGNYYGPGDVVKHSGAYYQVINAAGTNSDPTTTPADFSVLTGQLFEIPYLSHNDGQRFPLTSRRQFPLHSWLEWQSPTN